MRVLVVEDDAQLRGFLMQALGRDGYEVEGAGDGLEALAQVGQSRPDLMLMDVGLPEMNGVEVLRALRGAGARFPVVMLSGETALDTKVECLEVGADDYMQKPFAMRELRARLGALRRRSEWLEEAAGEGEGMEWGAWRLDRGGRVVCCGEERVALTGREFQVLEALLGAGGRAVGRAELLQRIWGRADGRVNLLDVCVSGLRRKLGGLDGKGWIESVRGEGYRLASWTGALGAAAEA